MPQLKTPVSTFDISDVRRDFDVSKKIALYEPDSSKFTIMLLRTKKNTVGSAKFYYYDDDPDAYKTQINAASGYAVGITALVVDDSTPFAQYDVLMNGRTEEHMLVGSTDDGTNTVNVTRGYGETAAAAINDDDVLIRLGNAMAEGSKAPTPKSNQPSELWNCTQILRTTIQVTRTNEAEKKKTGQSERNRLIQKKMITHRKEIERIVLWGERKYDVSAKRRTSGGLITTFINTNVFNGGGVLTEDKFNEYAEMAFAYGDSEEKILVCSARVLTAINKFATNKLQTNVADKKYGLRLDKYITAHGTFALVKSQALTDNFANEAVCVDMENIAIRPFVGADTKLRKNIHDADYDGTLDEYMTEFSLQVNLEKTHSRLTNVTG